MADFINEWVDGPRDDPREYICEWHEGGKHRCACSEDMADADGFARYLSDTGKWTYVHETLRTRSYPGKVVA